MYVTFSLVLVFLSPGNTGIATAVVPLRTNQSECWAEAKRIMDEQRAYRAFCVKTEGK